MMGLPKVLARGISSSAPPAEAAQVTERAAGMRDVSALRRIEEIVNSLSSDSQEP
jgi:hypothetical protein